MKCIEPTHVIRVTGWAIFHVNPKDNFKEILKLKTQKMCWNQHYTILFQSKKKEEEIYSTTQKCEKGDLMQQGIITLIQI